MQISIIGSGNMATGIGTRFSSPNNQITIYDKEPNKAQELASKLGNDTQAKAISEPFDGEIVILAIPFGAVADVIVNHKEDLKNKIVVDITNPVNFETMQLIPGRETSGAEEIAKMLPEGAELVKAFNTTLAGTLLQGEVAGQKLDVFVAGDSETAKQKLITTINDGGLRALDAGKLENARHLEGVQVIHFLSQSQTGANWMSTIKILQ